MANKYTVKICKNNFFFFKLFTFYDDSVFQLWIKFKSSQRIKVDAVWNTFRISVGPPLETPMTQQN